MKAITHLKKLWLDAKVKSSPERPIHTWGAMPTFNAMSKEKKELKRTELFLNLVGGCKANIISNSGKRIDNRKQYVDSVGFNRTIGSVEYRPSDLQNGFSDIQATIKGRACYLELKRKYKNGKDRQSEAQKKFQAQVEEAMALYIIFESFEDFYKRVFPVIKDNPMISSKDLTSKLNNNE